MIFTRTASIIRHDPRAKVAFLRPVDPEFTYNLAEFQSCRQADADPFLFQVFHQRVFM
jgi:hypothetical protein